MNKLQKFSSFNSWKRAVKNAFPTVEFAGDEKVAMYAYSGESKKEVGRWLAIDKKGFIHAQRNPRKLKVSRSGIVVHKLRIGAHDPRKLKRVARRLLGRGVKINPRTSTKSIINLARKNMGNNGSARLCLKDAIDLEAEGNLAAAKKRALDSLKHSVGVFHPDYKKAAKGAVQKNPRKRLTAPLQGSTRRIIRRSKEVLAHTQRVLDGVKGTVCVQVQSGANWKTVMQSKDTPTMRQLAKRYALSYKRAHPGQVVRVVTY